MRSGSLGKAKYESEEVETDPLKAYYELGVNMAPLPGSGAKVWDIVVCIAGPLALAYEDAVPLGRLRYII